MEECTVCFAFINKEASALHYEWHDNLNYYIRRLERDHE